MKNSNIIISVVIVLCIAGAVTAYGLANPEDNIFTNLAGFTPEEDSATDDGVEDTGEGGAGDNGPIKGGSSEVGSGSISGSTSGLSSSEALQIATDGIEVPGCYPGNPEKLENGNWYVPVLNSNGEIVDGFEIDYKTGHRGRI